MATIIPTTEPAYWLVKEDGSTGITRTTEVTAVSNSVNAVFAEGEMAFLDALEADGTVVYPPLPAEGAQLEQGEVYDYQGTLLMVRQSHTRTEHDPTTVPALFLVYQPGGGVLGWVAGEQVYIDTHRIYDGIEYVCIQAHVTQFPPPDTPALWNVVPSSEEWQAGVAYSIDDVVTYQGTEYVCIQAHVSQVGWEPPNVPALWQPV